MKKLATDGKDDFHFKDTFLLPDIDLNKVKTIVESCLKEDGYVYQLNILNDTSIEVKVSAPL